MPTTFIGVLKIAARKKKYSVYLYEEYISVGKSMGTYYG